MLKRGPYHVVEELHFCKIVLGRQLGGLVFCLHQRRLSQDHLVPMRGSETLPNHRKRLGRTTAHLVYQGYVLVVVILQAYRLSEVMGI